MNSRLVSISAINDTAFLEGDDITYLHAPKFNVVSKDDKDLLKQQKQRIIDWFTSLYKANTEFDLHRVINIDGDDTVVDITLEDALKLFKQAGCNPTITFHEYLVSKQADFVRFDGNWVDYYSCVTLSFAGTKLPSRKRVTIILVHDYV
jgi:hypothetical protein